MFVRGGQYYEGAIFRFRLLIPRSYPCTEVPRLFFQSTVFHPRVNEVTGEVDVSRYYPAWDPARDRLWHLLRYVRHMFYKIDVSNPVNEGAASLLTLSEDMYLSTVRRCVEQSERLVYAETANVIRFEPPNHRHESARVEIKEWDRRKFSKQPLTPG